MSGRPTTKPSVRAVSTMPVPLASIACRAARMRSTASRTSCSGLSSSPVESSIERPAMPVPAARRTCSATGSGSTAKPPSKSALTGTLTAAETARRWSRVWSSVTPLSARPVVQANPALVVARAGKPSRSSAAALPASHGFGMTKQPAVCSRRKAATRSSCTVIGPPHRPGPGPMMPGGDDRAMRAVVFEEYGARPVVQEVPDPVPAEHGVVVRVEATGLCRSDWHAWAGHDRTIALPHVPGHELAGTVHEVGTAVTRWRPGQRVTVPFVCACGSCEQCLTGNHQVCERQTQPGFTGWGSFAELVALDHADVNLVGLPDDVEAAAAAGLGCRVATAHRAVVAQGRVQPGQWVAVHGCGGVGLSAVMVAVAAGARVVAVDVAQRALELARQFGAEVTVDAAQGDAVTAVRAATGGGAHLSLDALGSHDTCAASVKCLRTRGRHVQVGLLPPDLGHPAVPMARVIALELELVGSHGMAAHDYPALLGLVAAGRLRPDLLVTRRIGLDEAGDALTAMGEPGYPAGVTVVEPQRGAP